MAAKTRTFLALGGAVLVALSVSGCGGADVMDAPVEKKSFAFSGRTLTVAGHDSGLTLVPADVQQIEVERQVDGWALLGSGPEPVWELRGDTLDLKVKCSGIATNCQARHSVKVPRGVTVNVESDNGRVEAAGFTTDMAVTTDNGEIAVKDMSGRLNLKTSNGEIVGERLAARSVTARTDNGTVEMGFAATPDLVDGGSDNGSIRLTLPKATYKVDVETGNGEARVDVPKAETSSHVVKLRTDNGEVTVRSAN
ncbi:MULTISPECIES: DUF4097 family beta strand repeat-containing protein [Streptomyces]|uniref:DUF4097 family beta strand repeat-containing protein n=1 Tax=Streptomyces cremeus TaxID=66881 RepID=A0ABV5PEJ3_STRCM